MTPWMALVLVSALGGRELRARQITTATPGLLDLRAVLALDRPLTCAYVGVRLKAEQAGAARCGLPVMGAVQESME
jgi:hypothetical protein